MTFDLSYTTLSYIALSVGALLLFWGQYKTILGWIKKLVPETFYGNKTKKDNGMSPAERFDTFYALRCWCKKAGYNSAVTALDDEILPAIVRTEGPVEMPQ